MVSNRTIKDYHSENHLKVSLVPFGLKRQNNIKKTLAQKRSTY